MIDMPAVAYFYHLPHIFSTGATVSAAQRSMSAILVKTAFDRPSSITRRGVLTRFHPVLRRRLDVQASSRPR